MSASQTFNQQEQDRKLVKAVTDDDLVAIVNACEAGANPNVRDPATGRNLLFTVMDRIDDPFHAENKGSLWAHFMALVQHGADAGLPDNNGITPFHYGLDRRDNIVVCVMMVQPGLDLNAPDPRDGRTPLHKALPPFLDPADKLDSCPFEMLVNMGANPLVPDAGGHTVLDMARAAEGETARQALEKLEATAPVRQKLLRDRAREKPLRLKP